MKEEKNKNIEQKKMHLIKVKEKNWNFNYFFYRAITYKNDEFRNVLLFYIKKANMRISNIFISFIPYYFEYKINNNRVDENEYKFLIKKIKKNWNEKKNKDFISSDEDNNIFFDKLKNNEKNKINKIFNNFFLYKNNDDEEKIIDLINRIAKFRNSLIHFKDKKDESIEELNIFYKKNFIILIQKIMLFLNDDLKYQFFNDINSYVKKTIKAFYSPNLKNKLIEEKKIKIENSNITLNKYKEKHNKNRKFIDLKNRENREKIKEINLKLEEQISNKFENIIEKWKDEFKIFNNNQNEQLSLNNNKFNKKEIYEYFLEKINKKIKIKFKNEEGINKLFKKVNYLLQNIELNKEQNEYEEINFEEFTIEEVQKRNLFYENIVIIIRKYYLLFWSKKEEIENDKNKIFNEIDKNFRHDNPMNFFEGKNYKEKFLKPCQKNLQEILKKLISIEKEIKNFEKENKKNKKKYFSIINNVKSYNEFLNREYKENKKIKIFKKIENEIFKNRKINIALNKIITKSTKGDKYILENENIIKSDDRILFIILIVEIFLYESKLNKFLINFISEINKYVEFLTKENFNFKYEEKKIGSINEKTLFKVISYINKRVNVDENNYSILETNKNINYFISIFDKNTNKIKENKKIKGYEWYKKTYFSKGINYIKIEIEKNINNKNIKDIDLNKLDKIINLLDEEKKIIKKFKNNFLKFSDRKIIINIEEKNELKNLFDNICEKLGKIKNELNKIKNLKDQFIINKKIEKIKNEYKINCSETDCEIIFSDEIKNIREDIYRKGDWNKISKLKKEIFNKLEDENIILSKEENKNFLNNLDIEKIKKTNKFFIYFFNFLEINYPWNK